MNQKSLTKIRKAQRKVSGIENIYYFRSVESVRQVLLHARNGLNDVEYLKSVMDGIEALKKN
ncbi:hypothetical protein ACQKNS_07165 [Peribacillus sp. NPDC094092]|uniref:hypothetical protein n=1 Tax=Peribacillus sp. NPDC094092 TaxID=3390611 RepID=UPI003CFD1451